MRVPYATILTNARSDTTHHDKAGSQDEQRQNINLKMIRYLDLNRITAMHGEEISAAVDNVVRSGWYLKGTQTTAFENSYADFIGTRHCIGCGNGLDALTLIFRAYIEMGVMQKGDEVIVPANTYIASILAITENGLVPVMVEPDINSLQIDYTKIEESISQKTRAILLVHLYGRCAYTEDIGEICRRHSLKLIEDNAQAHGCLYFADGQADALSETATLRRTGSIGDAAGHSFYPGKNLGAMGDAGAVTTDDDKLADTVRSLGNYGSARKYVFNHCGRNSRIDEIQAALLSIKLKYLADDNRRRKEIARRYETEISHDDVRITCNGSRDNVYHVFPVFSKRRDELQQYMQEQGVETMIHYPIPPHRQHCYPQFAHLSLPVTEQIHREELSLPCHQAMTDDEVDTVIHAINNF